MLSGFKQFILRGNVIDLAVGVIIGGAFGTIVSSLTADVINPILASIIGKPDLSHIKAGEIMVGKFLNSIINFLITAAGLYFLIVMPFNHMMQRFAKEPPPAPPAPPSPTETLLAEIRDLLRKK
jgi:large conductance mechanosensitive channel